MLAGQAALAIWLVASASLALVAVSVIIVMRQRAAHTALLLVAALAWAPGSVAHALDASTSAVVPCWLALLVLTIAAERLEMTRLMRRRHGAASLLCTICTFMLLGAALSAADAAWGAACSTAFRSRRALWLFAFDVARRTLRANGLSRYMAICLLLGYLWLFSGGIARSATALGLPFRDTALHGLALGFVFSMVLAHAPVIVPAIARVKLHFGWAYYVPLCVLHLSLVVRLVRGHFDSRAFAAGAAGNALAVGALAATLVGSAVTWRVRRTLPPPRGRPLPG